MPRLSPERKLRLAMALTIRALRNSVTQHRAISLPNLLRLCRRHMSGLRVAAYRQAAAVEQLKRVYLRHQPFVVRPRVRWSGQPTTVRIWVTMDSLKTKLHPRRFPNMSPMMMAILGYMLDEHYTTPEIEEMAVSEEENRVYIRKAGDTGFNGIQSLEDLRNNWNRLMDVAGLTPVERAEAVGLFKAKVEKLPGM